MPKINDGLKKDIFILGLIDRLELFPLQLAGCNLDFIDSTDRFLEGRCPYQVRPVPPKFQQLFLNQPWTPEFQDVIRKQH